MALDLLLGVPNSSIRIHDADFCLQHGGSPKVPFHPKTFLMRTTQRDFVLAGSGNMSRSGLSRGVEAGLVVSASRDPEAEPVTAVQTMRTWFSSIWREATPLSADILRDYAQLFERKENLKAPTPTEDDIASSDMGRGSLSAKDLQKLRICKHFWIEAGNITKNRGVKLPGNQLMMKRLSRVFFGFDSNNVPKNTHIGNVEISFNGGLGDEFSLTYSDNKMEKLVLPIPDVGGPPAYDNKYLLFRKIKPRIFELIIGSKAMKNRWRKNSTAIDATFKMSSGREWGVF